MAAPSPDAHQTAVIETPLDEDLEPGADGTAEEATVQQDSGHHMGIKVSAGSRGLLVLSELFYPGWEARVNGMPERLHEVNGGLRAIVVPKGESQVTIDYAPTSVTLGSILSGLTFALILVGAAFWLRR